MDVVGWLRRLGLERYEAIFRENEITERVLPSLTAEDLKELGVTALLERPSWRLTRKAHHGPPLSHLAVSYARPRA